LARTHRPSRSNTPSPTGELSKSSSITRRSCPSGATGARPEDLALALRGEHRLINLLDHDPDLAAGIDAAERHSPSGLVVAEEVLPAGIGS
jgi:hypothetical protein